MRDWTRYEEAKSLRESGLTLKQVGEALGVSVVVAESVVTDRPYLFPAAPTADVA